MKRPQVVLGGNPEGFRSRRTLGEGGVGKVKGKDSDAVKKDIVYSENGSSDAS